jgi:ribonuclease P protein component
VLPAENRLRRAEDFRRTVRSGRATRRPLLTVHMSPGSEAGAPRVGFVVGRAVGTAVDRHRVQRRLRHLVRDRLAALPRGSTVVVRVAPAAATATSAQLGADLDAALTQVLRPLIREGAR